jgi:hypothetical protein
VRDDLEGCVDCESPVEGYTRRQALKFGALSLGGAVVAAVLPGRLRAGGFNQVCGIPGNCSVGFPFCVGSGVGLGCNCFTTTEGRGTCGANDFCVNLSSCATSTDCPFGYFCATVNGCTGCAGGPGVCIQTCGPGAPSAAKSHARQHGMTAAGIRH